MVLIPFACIKRKQGNFKPEIPFQNNTGLPWTASQKALSNIHEKYVLVPADKAANNVNVIWRKFYIDVLSNELKSIHTYKKVNTSEMEIFDSHDSFKTWY